MPLHPASGHMCYFVWEDECTDVMSLLCFQVFVCKHTEMWSQLKPEKSISEFTSCVLNYRYSFILSGERWIIIHQHSVHLSFWWRQIIFCLHFFWLLGDTLHHNLTPVLDSLPHDNKRYIYRGCVQCRAHRVNGRKHNLRVELAYVAAMMTQVRGHGVQPGSLSCLRHTKHL